MSTARDDREMWAFLREAPLIDGHNDLPHRIRSHARNDAPDGRRVKDVAGYPTAHAAPGQTDMERLGRGGVGAQFWAVFVPCGRAGPGAAAYALDQFDVVRALEERHPELEPAWSADEVEAAVGRGVVASLIGVEGGHALEGSLGVLRAFRGLGARYLTLTHNCSNEWADSATDDEVNGGLGGFGRDVVRELNRLGMLVDLSHASVPVMRDALEVSTSPVVFTHSGARALTDHPRNVPDDVLEAVRDAGGVVGVPFVPRFVSERVRRWAESGGAGSGAATERSAPPEDGSEAPVSEGDRSPPRATVEDVADHVEHVRRVAGLEHVAVGSDFDGTAELPEGLEDVSCFPALFSALAARGWTDEELRLLAGGNWLRVMRAAEAVADASCRKGRARTS